MKTDFVANFEVRKPRVGKEVCRFIYSDFLQVAAGSFRRDLFKQSFQIVRTDADVPGYILQNKLLLIMLH